MNAIEDNLNHEQEQLNRLQGIFIIDQYHTFTCIWLEQIRNIQRHLLFDLNNREGDLEGMDDDEDDEDWEDAEAGKTSGEKN
jgi:hypothetical protein